MGHQGVLNANRLGFCVDETCRDCIPSHAYLPQTTPGFIQASLSKVQGLYKDF